MNHRDFLQELLAKATVLPDDECQKLMREGGAVLMCPRAEDGGYREHFKDDCLGKCTVCGLAVYFRPYNIAAVNKVCIHCFLKNAPKGKEK